MVAGCDKSKNGEHYGIDGRLVRLSLHAENDFTIIGHFVGNCLYCGREIHFTATYIRYEEEYGPDTLEPVHLGEGYVELEVE